MPSVFRDFHRCLALALLAALLTACAPHIPAAPDSLAAQLLKQNVSPSWPGEGKYYMPAPDAPPDEILAFLAGMNSEAGAFVVDESPIPENNVFHIPPGFRPKLLPFVQDQPLHLPLALPYLPPTDAAHHIVRQLYDQAQTRSFEGLPSYWQKSVHTWLMWQGDFPDELRAAAGEANFDGNELAHESDLRALCERDWPTAETLLDELAKKSSLMAVVRDGSKFRHAQIHATGDADAWRSRLQALATSKDADPGARFFAIKTLLSVDWQGQESFALSLVTDGTLYALSDKNPAFSWPLHDWIQDDAHMQRVAPLLEDPRPEVRKAAGRALDASDRLDAIRIMYQHPDAWIDDASQDRLFLLQEFQMPEAADWLAEHAGPAGVAFTFDSLNAAIALANQAPARAAPFLRPWMTHDIEGNENWHFLVALARSGALTDDQWYDYITTGGFSDRYDRWDWQARTPLGQVLGNHQPLAARLVTHMHQLPPATAPYSPSQADRLWYLIRDWPAPAVDAEIMQRLTQEPLDFGTVILTTKHPQLAQHQGSALRRLADAGGPRAGIAAAALHDPALSRRILTGNDGPAIQMLLTCTRLNLQPLPLDLVGQALGSSDFALAQAAEKWLVSNDSPPAQELVRRHHWGTLVVLGGGNIFPLDGSIVMPGIPDLYAQMTLPDGPDEIFALLAGGGFPMARNRVITVTAGIATVTFFDEHAIKQTRPLAPAELASLQNFIAQRNIDNLPPLGNDAVLDGVDYTYVHLTRTTGRMVQISNPGVAGTAGTPYDLLVRRFRALATAPTR